MFCLLLQKHYLDWVAQGGAAAAAPAAKPNAAPAAAPAPAAKPAAAAAATAAAAASRGEPQTVVEAVRQLREENPEISGFKKLVAEVKARFGPALEANGVKVGSREVREALKVLETGGGADGDDAAGGVATGPRNGLILNEASAKQLFGVVKTLAAKVRGKVVPAGVEGGNAEYKLISWAWRKGVGPEGPCRRIVLRAKVRVISRSFFLEIACGF